MNQDTEREGSQTRAFYDRISRVYDRVADAGEHEARERGLELLAVRDGEHVLEVGFGTGHSLVSLAGSVGEGGRVDGVDISSGMLEVAGRRVSEAGVSGRVHLRLAEAPPLPYDDGAFDVVTMSFTLELFPLEVIPSLLAEVRRVLVTSGRLGIVSMSETRPGEPESALTHTYKWLHRHFPHIVDCQPIPARTLVREAGFEIEGDDDLSIWTLRVAAFVARVAG